MEENEDDDVTIPSGIFDEDGFISRVLERSKVLLELAIELIAGESIVLIVEVPATLLEVGTWEDEDTLAEIKEYQMYCLIENLTKGALWRRIY